MLPLDKVAFEEKKGGWGRHLKGAERAVTKLAKDPATLNMANELQEFLGHVENARKLQDKKICALRDVEYEQAIVDMRRVCPSVFNASMDKRCIGRTAFRAQVALSTGQLLPKEAMQAHITSVAVWPLQLPRPAFDHLNAALSSCTRMNSAAKVQIFDKYIVNGVMVPLIMRNNTDKLRQFVSTFMEMSSDVSDLELDTTECQCRTDFLEISQGLLGITGSSNEVADSLDQIIALTVEEQKPSGDYFMAAIARAVRMSNLKVKAKDICDKAPLLQSTLPQLKAHVTKLKNTGGFEQCAALSEAAAFLVDVSQHLSSSWRGDLEDEVRAACKGNINDAVQNLQSLAGQEDGDVELQVKEMGKMLSEVALAFPMESFHIELQEQLGEISRDFSNRKFDLAFKTALAEFTASWQGRREPEPPSELCAQALAGFVRKGTPGMHFKDEATQAEITEAVNDFAALFETQFTKPWHEAIATVYELEPFAVNARPNSKLAISLAAAFMKFDGEIASSSELAQKPLKESAEFLDSVSHVNNRFLTCTENMKKFAINSNAGDPIQFESVFKKYFVDQLAAWNAILEGVNQLQADRIQKILSDSECLQLGVPNGGGTELWLGATPVQEWTDWDCLVDQYEKTLKKVKAKDLADSIKDVKSASDFLVKYECTVSADLGFKAALQKAAKQLLLIKSTHIIMRDLTSKKKVDDIRPAIRVELLDIAKAFTPEGKKTSDFGFSSVYPKAMAEKAAAVVSGNKRKTKA